MAEKKKGKLITTLGVGLGSLLGKIGPVGRAAGPLVGGSSEAFRQSLFPNSQETGLQGLKQVGEAAGATLTAQLLGKLLGAVTSPIQTLASKLTSNIVKSGKTVPMADLVKGINEKVAPKLDYYPEAFTKSSIKGVSKGKEFLNSLKSQLSRFGTAPAEDVAERNIPLSNINILRGTIGAKGNWGKGIPTVMEEAGNQAYYPLLKEAITKNIPGAGTNLSIQSALQQLKAPFSKVASGTGEKVGGLYLHGIPALLGKPFQKILGAQIPSPMASSATPTSAILGGLIGGQLPFTGGSQPSTNQQPSTGQILPGQQPTGQEQIAPQDYFAQQLGMTPDKFDSSGQWMWDEQANDWIPNEAYAQSPYNQAGQQTQGGNLPFTQEDILKLMQEDLSKGGKNISELNTIASQLKQVQEEGQPKLSATERLKSTFFESAYELAKEFEDKALNFEGTGLGPGTQTKLFQSIYPDLADPALMELDSTIGPIRESVINAISGAQVSSQEANRVKGWIPDIAKSPEKNRQDMKSLTNWLKVNYENFSNKKVSDLAK